MELSSRTTLECFRKCGNTFASVLFSVFLFCIFALKQAIAADSINTSDHLPKLCTGYNSSSSSWSVPLANEQGERLCDRSHAIYGATRIAYGAKTTEEVFLQAVCCPLPADDILTDHHSWEDRECSAEAVVTGYDSQPIERMGKKVARVRCTKINTNRYRLSPPISGAFWGVGSTAALPWKEDIRLLRAGVPVAIRYGLERVGPTSHTLRGCVGSPIGSLLVGRNGKRCKDFVFRELQFLDNSSVQMFPECKQISGLFDHNASCVK